MVALRPRTSRWARQAEDARRGQSSFEACRIGQARFPRSGVAAWRSVCHFGRWSGPCFIRGSVSCGGIPGLRLNRIGLAACMVWLDAHFSSLSAPPGIGDSGQPRIFRRRLDPHGSVCPRKILVCPIPECDVCTRPVSVRRKGRKNCVSSRGVPDGPRYSVRFGDGAGGAQHQAMRGPDETRSTDRRAERAIRQDGLGCRADAAGRGERSRPP